MSARAGESSHYHPYEQGIYLKNTTYSTISGNTTDHNTCIGIRLTNGSNYNLVSNNISYSNYSVVETDAAGIETTGASYNTIINNVTYSNEDSGINIYVNSSLVCSPPTTLSSETSATKTATMASTSTIHPTIPLSATRSMAMVRSGLTLKAKPATGSHHTMMANNISAGNGFTPPAGSFGGNLRVDSASVNRDDHRLQPLQPRERHSSDHLERYQLYLSGSVPCCCTDTGSAWAGRRSTLCGSGPVCPAADRGALRRRRNFRQLLPQRRIAGDRQRQCGCSQPASHRHRWQQPHRRSGNPKHRRRRAHLR